MNIKDTSNIKDSTQIKSLLMKILITLLLLSGILANAEPNYGLIIDYQRKELIDDVLYILKTILLNIKSHDHKDIVSETKRFLYTESQAITDIEAVSMVFKTEDLAKSFSLKDSTGELEMTAQGPILTYTFAYNWAMKTSMFSTNNGTGFFTATSKKLGIKVTLKEAKFDSEVTAEFEYKLGEVKGTKVDDSIKKFLSEKLTAAIPKGITEALTLNKNLIHKYLFTQVAEASYNVFLKIPLIYKNSPYSWKLVGQRIVVRFGSSVNAIDKSLYPTSTIDLVGEGKDITMIINRELVLMNLKLIHQLASSYFAIDLKALGFPETMEGFFEINQEWRNRFYENATVTPKCFTEKFDYTMPDFNGSMNINCTFEAKNLFNKVEDFMYTKALFNLNFIAYTAPEIEYMLTGKITEAKFSFIETNPDNFEAKEFALRLMTEIREKYVVNKLIKYPRLRYQPLRIYKNLTAKVQDEVYTTVYDF